MMKKLLCVFLLLMASISAFAASFEETKAAAERGSALAQFNLGVMYSKGNGVKQDYAEAAKWYTKSADQGYALAKKALVGLKRLQQLRQQSRQ